MSLTKTNWKKLQGRAVNIACDRLGIRIQKESVVFKAQRKEDLAHHRKPITADDDKGVMTHREYETRRQ